MKKTFSTVLLLGSLVLLSFVFLWSLSKPRICVFPEEALIDEPVEISVCNLAPNSQITLKASCKDKDNDKLESYAVFQAGAKGVVNVSTQAPISGSYNGIDPMGLFWSMKPTDKEVLKKVPPTFNFYEVSLSLFVDNKLKAEKTIQRLPVSRDVEKRTIREQGIVGTLFYPKNMQHGPGIIVVAGSGGRIPESLAQLFASHGNAVLALGYFGIEGLPEKLKNIPLEYFQNAMKWFKSQPQVDKNRIVICGNSRGGELVLLLASTFPQEMNAVIAYTPSSMVFGDDSWTYNNMPIPGLPRPSDEETQEAEKKDPTIAHKGTFEDPEESTQQFLYLIKKYKHDIIEAATIPVEKIQCPILLISGEDDKVWPSTLFSNMVMARLDEKKSTITRKHVHFPSAGHGVQNPYFPSSNLPYFHPRAKTWETLGGTAEGNARANEQAWKAVLEFLKKTLGQNTYQFDFKHVEDKDLPLLYTWFKQPHVEQWWPVPEKEEDFFTTFLNRIRSGIKNAYIVLCNNVPIGYIQSYTIDRKTSTWLPQIPGNGNIIGIDQFIGEPEYLHKGIGTLFIKQFVDECIAKDKDLSIIVDPEPANAAAIRCYEKVGFNKLGTYQAPWGPALVMIYKKEK